MGHFALRLLLWFSPAETTCQPPNLNPPRTTILYYTRNQIPVARLGHTFHPLHRYLQLSTTQRSPLHHICRASSYSCRLIIRVLYLDPPLQIHTLSAWISSDCRIDSSQFRSFNYHAPHLLSQLPWRRSSFSTTSPLEQRSFSHLLKSRATPPNPDPYGCAILHDRGDSFPAIPLFRRRTLS